MGTHLSEMTRHWRPLLTTTVLVATLAGVLVLYDQVLPLDTWIVWKHLKILGATLVIGMACLSVGLRLFRLLHRASVPILERIGLAYCYGTLAFALLIFLAGVAGLLKPALFFLAPGLLLALGGIRPWSWGKRVWRSLAFARHRYRWRSSSAALLLAGFGALGLLGLLLPTWSPAHVGYDSAWYHLPIAEHYVAAQRIGPFLEGWVPGSQPQLGSWLYTWAYLMPASSASDKVILCMQLECLALLFTCVSVSQLAWRLGARFPARLSWVVMMLFPGLFFYDLGAGADHFAALFAAPLFLQFLRCLATRQPRAWVSLGVLCGGALLTKYTAAILVLPFLLMLSVAFCARALESTKTRRWSELRKLAYAALALSVTGLMVTAPHWLKNWLWYGDPLYPTLHNHLTAPFWNPDASVIFDAWKSQSLSHPPRTFAGMKESLVETLRFSFTRHDFGQSTKGIPTNSFLFGVASILALFTRPKRSLLMALGAVYLGVFTWYNLHHQDRYLQALLPIQAAVVSAILTRIWEYGRVVRATSGLLIFLQLCVCAHVFWWPHRHGWMKDSYERFSSAVRGAAASRDAHFYPWKELDRTLPKRAKVLIHEEHVHTGLQRQSVSDWIQWQGAINYGRMSGRAELHRTLERLGISHLAWEAKKSKGYDSLASDLLFFAYATQNAGQAQKFGRIHVASIATTPPPSGDEQVLVILCDGTYEAGLYQRADLTVPPQVRDAPYPSPRSSLENGPLINEDMLSGATMIVRDPKCKRGLTHSVSSQFPVMAHRGRVELRVRQAAK